MKLLIICYLSVMISREISGMFSARVIPPLDQSTDDDRWFKQILNHFSKSNPTYWDQRYFVNEDIWTRTDSSPVFLMVGGEDYISSSWMNGGAWVVWAYKYGALLFQLEHRFYGKSHPTSDVSVANLDNLNSRQAIEDIKYFIQQMNKQYNLTSNNKWILFGGSYPGALAAWARLKLPNQVYGAVSSSGPIQAKADFFEFYNVVRTSLETYSKGCATQLTNAIAGVQTLFSTTKGTKTAKKKFNICGGFDAKNAMDLRTFYITVTTPVGNAVLNNKIGKPTESIDYVCGFLNDKSKPDPVDRLAALSLASNDDCLYASYVGNVQSNNVTSWDEGAVTTNIRQWMYQTCNEFGFFQTSSSTSSLLKDTVPLDYFTQQCTDVFGKNFNAAQLNSAVDQTNSNYGGANIDVKRVVFVQGSVDPWQALGKKNSSTDSPFIYIDGTTHTQDMISPAPSDSKPLKDARKKIEQSLDSWLL